MRWRVSSAAATTRAREAASSERLCALAIAVAASSVNCVMRLSRLLNTGCASRQANPSRPHNSPSTMIGAPAVERRPRPRRISADGLDAPSRLKMPVACPGARSGPKRCRPRSADAGPSRSGSRRHVCRYHGDRRAAFVAQQDRMRSVEQAARLGGDRIEHLGRRGATSDGAWRRAAAPLARPRGVAGRRGWPRGPPGHAESPLRRRGGL